MQKTMMAEGIIDILPHLAAICLETPEFHGLPVPDLAQDVEPVTPEEIVQIQTRSLLHAVITSFLLLNIYIIF
jgi:hypothetical protein